MGRLTLKPLSLLEHVCLKCLRFGTNRKENGNYHILIGYRLGLYRGNAGENGKDNGSYYIVEYSGFRSGFWMFTLNPKPESKHSGSPVFLDVQILPEPES